MTLVSVAGAPRTHDFVTIAKKLSTLSGDQLGKMGNFCQQRSLQTHDFLQTWPMCPPWWCEDHCERKRWYNNNIPYLAPPPLPHFPPIITPNYSPISSTTMMTPPTTTITNNNNGGDSSDSPPLLPTTNTL